jgi:thiol-disulfide isomerase/thioredoxin
MLFNTNISGMLASCRIALCFIMFSSAANAAGDAVIVTSKPQSLPEMTYTNDKGLATKVNAKGMPLTALHFWATWCVPCMDELIQVDKAQKAYGGQGFKVIALSLDGKNNLAKVQKFYKDHRITSLEANIDADMSIFKSVMLRGLPTTIFLNADGKEIARAEGALDWEAPDTLLFIENQLK